MGLIQAPAASSSQRILPKTTSTFFQAASLNTRTTGQALQDPAGTSFTAMKYKDQSLCLGQCIV